MNEQQHDRSPRSVDLAKKNSTPLSERLDDALGEASSGIGVLLSELVRRTLRGGVQQIEEEMESFVQEKVDAEVVHRMPDFQEAATQTAQLKAKEIATEAVATVDRQAKESAERLAQELAEADRRAKEGVERLTGELTEAERRAADVQLQTKEEMIRLTGDLAEAERRVADAQRQAKEELEARIAETQRLAEEATQQHLERLKENSKKVVATIQANLETHQGHLSALTGELTAEREARAAQFGTLQRDLLQHVGELQRRVGRLEEQVTELQKPRGLRALFAKLFRRKKKQQSAQAEEEPVQA